MHLPKKQRSYTLLHSQPSGAGRFGQSRDKVDMFSVSAGELSTLPLDVVSSVRSGHVVSQLGSYAVN